ncbi:putative disease resistance protein RGA3 [Malania oleifera]|uniref:putative disease resistance protein RGA3 n=1 Tax=Malania oleifera TaxID=397392 RepID=UPI0025ADA0EF|nr:putative disease resistance protein RGA3 [Malania oleifera]XP_057976321.1 putative disease resistance protein RGA3 [Malania oleifera]
MAEAILFNFAEQILEQLGSRALIGIGSAWGIKGEFRKLENTVSTIKALLRDAEEQSATSHEVRDWLGKLKDAVYDADDLLDYFSTQASRRKASRRKAVTRGNLKMVKQVCSFFPSSNRLVLGFKMARSVKAIRERLAEIPSDRIQFHSTTNCTVESRGRAQTHSFVRKEIVVGRDDDKKAIMELLLDADGERSVSVISIVGMGGLGKTTLAQLVYNDEIIISYFELKIWVCVSNNFDVRIIVEKILESTADKKFESLEMDKLQIFLRKEIDGKKYLLVLDDVWNENCDMWLKLEDLLMGGAKGSKILVTTRSNIVAKVSSTIASYPLKGLTNGESRSLFKQMAFENGGEPRNPKIVTIGQEILKKCSGVPFAIRSLGSLLYCKDTEVEWMSFKNIELPKIPHDEIDIMSILKLSYDHLPPHLKYCFAYCSLYPKDYNINKQSLIDLWMAQGFIQSSNGNECLEGIADKYFMDLLRRSFFQDVETDDLGNIIGCKMYDLMHNLAQFVSGVESSLADLEENNIVEGTRHLSLNFNFNSSCEILPPFLNSSKIRTFLLPMQPLSNANLVVDRSTCETIISKFKCLRVLDLNNFGLESVPNSICKLKHLRYLDLSGNYGIKKLPKSITRLQNLQTLKLSYCIELEELPRDMKNLVSLIHLDLDGCRGLTYMPCGLGKLTTLQRLTRFVVGKNGSSSCVARLSELSSLDSLRGELTILHYGNLKNTSSEGKTTILKKKEHLQILNLKWNQRYDGSDADYNAVMQSLQPHPNLKVLMIERYGGRRFSSWIMDNMASLVPNLVEIRLVKCERCQHLPQFSQLPFLKSLHLELISCVEYMENSWSHDSSFTLSSSPSLEGITAAEGVGRRGDSTIFFPSLENLFLCDLPNLKGWWKMDNGMETAAAATAMTTIAEQQQHQQMLSSTLWFPCLSKVSIFRCPKLTSLPLLPHLEQLELNNVNGKLLQHLMMPMMMATAMSTTSFGTCSSSLTSSSSLSKLKFLSIKGIEDLESLPEEGLQNLSSLEHLLICWCPRLLYLRGGFEGLNSLRFLVLEHCNGLRSLSQGIQCLTALEELKILQCTELDFSKEDNMQLEGLGSLCALEIVGIPKMRSLPAWLQPVSTLQVIQIGDCSGLTSLPAWIGNLKALQKLQISSCHELESLPESLHCLTTLRYLSIHDSNELSARCRRETGEEWQKIAHIQEIWIDDTRI